MRKADLRKNHKHFDSAIKRYRDFAKKILEAKHVVKPVQEKRDIAESIILRLCANWEAFVDEHLIDCINVDASKLREFFAVPIPKNPSKNLCQALLFGKNGYMDFKSFGDLKGFSKKVLPDESNPFLSVSSQHARKIDEVYKIRNYLSHYSFFAKLALTRLYENTYKMRKFLEPGQFLLAYNAKRLFAYFDAFQGASDDMKSFYR